MDVPDQCVCADDMSAARLKCDAHVRRAVGRAAHALLLFSDLLFGSAACYAAHLDTLPVPQVRIKLKHMELEIRRREVTGTGGAKRTEVETLGKYEIMDGAPVRGESIPIRCRVLTEGSTGQAQALWESTHAIA